jgi:hypothetical protein
VFAGCSSTATPDSITPKVETAITGQNAALYTLQDVETHATS